MECNEQFLKDIPEAVVEYPELIPIEKNGTTILSGFIHLKDGNEVLDSYQIEVHPTRYYPDCYPLVYEIGGRIPKNIDWHVYPSGNCCLAVPAEERLDCVAGINLASFIGKQVVGYLFNQTYRRKNGYFYRERAHGLPGRLQFYNEVLDLHDIQSIIIALRIVSTGKEPTSRSKCFCGSNKKFEKCHRRRLRSLNRDASDIVIEDYNALKALITLDSNNK